MRSYGSGPVLCGSISLGWQAPTWAVADASGPVAQIIATAAGMRIDTAAEETRPSANEPSGSPVRRRMK